jgi:hypothetical protein
LDRRLGGAHSTEAVKKGGGRNNWMSVMKQELGRLDTADVWKNGRYIEKNV